jgi:acyl-phosphate glycerol 3-phosphate acyltransferase
MVGRIKGVDIRKTIVDGARGASLSWRKLGKTCGVLVGAMDVLKGFVAVLIADGISGEPLVIVLAGLAAIIGHNWSLFLQFTGGRGAATTGGALLYMMPKDFFIAFIIIFIPILLIKRKQYFTLPYLKKEFKTSDFFSAVFFGVLFFVNAALNGLSIISFSPLIFSLPMFTKALTISEKIKTKGREEFFKKL